MVLRSGPPPFFSVRHPEPRQCLSVCSSHRPSRARIGRTPPEEGAATPPLVNSHSALCCRWPPPTVGQVFPWTGHLRRTEGWRRRVPQVHVGDGWVWGGALRVLGATVIVGLPVPASRRSGGVLVRSAW